MKSIKYSNNYGDLELEIVSNYNEVSSIFSKDLNKELFFNIDIAEKIALISENKNIQLSVSIYKNKMFLVHHKSSSMAAICKLIKLNFKTEINSQNEISKLAKYNTFFI